MQVEREPKAGTGYNLERMQAAVKRLGHPERQYKVVHVGGTSGKGSTCAMIASILHAAGYTVGLYASPALMSPYERITVDDKMISAKVHDRIKTKLLEQLADLTLSDFELLTLIAFQYFAERHVDYAVIEVGVGGKLDATNVVQPTVAIVTEVGLDHMELLGKTKQAIAKDKQEIIKPGCIGLTGSTYIKRGTYINLDQAKIHTVSLQGIEFTYKRWKHLQLNAVATYQVRNAILAIEATSRLGIGSAAIQYGLRRVNPRGRFQVVSKKPLVIVDGAHNPQKMSAFVSALKTVVALRGKRVVAVCALKQTKDIVNTLKPLLPLVDELIITTFPGSHTLASIERSARRLKPALRIKKIAQAPVAYRELLKCLNKEEVGLVTGSLYLVGQLLPLL